MKFLLTLYVCSVVTGDCILPDSEYQYEHFHSSHSECVQKGLGESYELLFDGKIFPREILDQYELYPKFTCEKQFVPPPKPKIQPGEPT